MKKNRTSRLSDISKVMNRAVFSDIEHTITKYKYGSDAFMRILESRYSCHAFSHVPVSKDKLDMILEAGCRNEDAWVRPCDGVNAASSRAAATISSR